MRESLQQEASTAWNGFPTHDEPEARNRWTTSRASSTPNPKTPRQSRSSVPSRLPPRAASLDIPCEIWLEAHFSTAKMLRRDVSVHPGPSRCLWAWIGLAHGSISLSLVIAIRLISCSATKSPIVWMESAKFHSKQCNGALPNGRPHRIRL